MSNATLMPAPLVGHVAGWQHMGVKPLENLSDRAWYAYHCLPRSAPTNRLGKKSGSTVGLPAWRTLETEHKLPSAILSKLFKGERKSVDSKTLPQLAAALRVTGDWLTTGAGEMPILSGPYEDRLDHYAQHDPLTWVEQYADNPAAMKGTRFANPFEAAADELLKRGVPGRWLAEEREKARGHEWDRPAAGWTIELWDRAPKKRPKAEERTGPQVAAQTTTETKRAAG